MLFNTIQNKKRNKRTLIIDVESDINYPQSETLISSLKPCSSIGPPPETLPQSRKTLSTAEGLRGMSHSRARFPQE